MTCLPIGDPSLSPPPRRHQSLRAQVDSLGRRWSGRRPSDLSGPGRPPSADVSGAEQLMSAQADSDDIRLQVGDVMYDTSLGVTRRHHLPPHTHTPTPIPPVADLLVRWLVVSRSREVVHR